MLTLTFLTYVLALWLGLYLLGRGVGKVGLRYAGLGLVVYALGLALDILDDDPSAFLERVRWPLLFLPPLLWVGATLGLLPESRGAVWAGRWLLPIAVLFYAVGFAANAPDSGIGYLIFTVAALVPLAGAFIAVMRALRTDLPKRPVGLALAATLFFAIGTGFLLLPLDWIPQLLFLVAIGFDLAALGIAIAALDAFDEGETLLPDFLRSMVASGFAALIFGGQVGLGILVDGVSEEWLALLLGVTTAAILTQTFADPLSTVLDRLIFARFAHLRQARADLRAVARALPRMNEALDLENLSEEEFTRLTRRALSHLGDLQHLAASPLNRLPVIQTRLAARGEANNSLERAAELKALLTESIHRLKPRGKGEFGMTEEWRYFNALYVPYVLGLKPYNPPSHFDALDSDTRSVLEWFRVSVPERTLHNWQNAGAKLVAQQLKESGWK
jgi:hypothetical protein